MTTQSIDQPLVSILIPAYNAAASIGDTLRSVLEQSYSEIEVVVVDDGSTDETAEISAKVATADTRVRLIRQANQGVAAARNAALRASRGSLIAPLDADDLWHRDKIARQVQRFEASGSCVGVVYCWSSEIDGDGQVIAHRLDLDRYEGNVLAALVVTNFIDTSSVPLIRRAELVAIGGWDATLHAQDAQGCEDWQLYIRLARRCKFALEPAFLVGYRQSPYAMSKNVPRMRSSYRLVMDEVRRSCPELPAQVFRWSQAEFDIYIASLLREIAPLGRLFFYARGILRNPAWLFRRSTRKKLRWWLAQIRRRKSFTFAREPRPPSEIVSPFSALVPEPGKEVSEGSWMDRRRRWLSSLGNKDGQVM
jgi:glycosyltransferase involved in cell wall biosynthesis